MQAMILAAGMGKRLGELTAHNTKCMVEVSGKPMIDRMLEQLCELDIARIVVVVGYERDLLVDHIDSLDIPLPVVYVDNPVYNQTNNIYSLYLARDYLAQDDTILLESDLVFEGQLLHELVDDPWPTLALVDKYEHWMSGTVVKIDADDRISRFVPASQFKFDDIDEYYKTVNIYKFSKLFSESHYIPFLEAYCKALGNNEYYEQVLRVITMLDDSEMKAKKVEGRRWYEIDNQQDLAIAETMFALDEGSMLDSFAARYGGYWRYPGVRDFCYLVNPFYPSERLMRKMKMSFEDLLCQYPSGMRVNCHLAANWFGVREERMVVGNGAAELIKALLEETEGTVGIVRPTFEEYPNRLPEERLAVFEAPAPDFRYTADDLMKAFAERDLSLLVLINPDNPSGNYLSKDEVERLATWCDERNIRFVLDESFVDFADDTDASLISDAFMDAHPSAVVIKSISKSYGVPGIRLGIMVSADQSLIDAVKSSVSIWNINSFGEFYLQIAGRYQDDYVAALELFRDARARFVSELEAVDGLRVIPTQANYVMVEITCGVSSRALAGKLIHDYNLLIKDLDPKLKCPKRHYVRLAIRTPEENSRLVEVMQKCLKELG